MARASDSGWASKRRRVAALGLKRTESRRRKETSTESNDSATTHRSQTSEVTSPSHSGFFIFLFSFSKFTRIYPGRPAAGRPGPGRPAARRQGLLCKKKFRKYLCAGPWGSVARQRGGRPPKPPGSGAAGPGRPAVGRPALPPLYKGWLVPPPLICITKIPETTKKEGGRERGEALPDFRAGDCK